MQSIIFVLESVVKLCCSAVCVILKALLHQTCSMHQQARLFIYLFIFPSGKRTLDNKYYTSKIDCQFLFQFLHIDFSLLDCIMGNL